MTNPNRVRALIGSFAMANQTQFNRADGAGYDFLVDTVLALDPKNPQVAARLLSALKSWRVLEPARRAHAEAALRKVAGAAVAVARRRRHRHARARRKLTDLRQDCTSRSRCERCRFADSSTLTQRLVTKRCGS